MAATAGSSQASPAGRRRWWALAALTGANLLVFASVTIMNVALPAARADLALSTSATQSVVTLYSLTFGTLVLVGGRLADVLGLRRCLVSGLVGFALASLLGGVASEAGVLLLARALQGGTGALVAATAVSLMSVTFPAGRERGIAFAVLGIVMGIGTAGSFLLGGVLVDVLSWRWCLLVNVPLAVLVVGGVLAAAPRGSRRADARVDVLGAVLVTASLGALVVGLDRATAWGWWHAGTIALLVAGVLGLRAFVAVLRRAPQPLVPPHLMADRNRVAGYVAAVFAGIAMFAGMFVLTAFLQEVLALTPVQIGLAFLPFGAGAVVTTWLLPAFRDRAQPASVLAIGLVLTAAAVGTFVLFEPLSGYVTGVLPAMLLLGSGGTVVMITAADVATAGAGTDSGIAGSMVNSAQQVGAALGTALLTSVMTLTTRQELDGGAEMVSATVAGYSRAGLVGVLILLVASGLVWSMRDSSGETPTPRAEDEVPGPRRASERAQPE